MAAEFEPPQGEELDGLSSLDSFLSTVALLTDADQVGDGQNKVTLMTLHSAKGLEFPVVFLVGLEEGVFPHNRALSDETQMEEERRLCYVGMTRARYRLYLTNALSRTLWGQANYNAASRFLKEIPPEMVEEVLPPGRRADAGGAYGQSTFGDGGLGHEGWGQGGYGQRSRGQGGWGQGSYGQGGYGARRGGQPQPPEDDDFSPAIGSAGWGQSAQARRLQAATAPGDTPTPTFEPGDRVEHGRFGQGVVKSVTGDTVTVQFATAGQKILVAAYLRLADD